MGKLDLPNDLNLKLKKYRDMRYGENPHQKSAFYIYDTDSGYEQLAGIELSHNNLGDANHAWRLVCEFEDPTVAIIKHGNPSGIATKSDLAEAYRLAYEADTVSAFGGIIAVNRSPTRQMVKAMEGLFFELIVAADFSSEVVEELTKKRKKLRVVKAKKPPKQLEFTRVFNGYLVQTPDDIVEDPRKWKVVCGKKPTAKQYVDMEFAWKVVKHVRSNAIVIVKDKVMVGMGTGQPNRVNSVKLALRQAQGKLKRDKYGKTGAILASDAFFLFPDNVQLAAEASVSLIMQPGGSIRDGEVIAEAKKHKITMVFT